MDKIAIVTGASRGIGAATALTLAKNGYKVCVNYLKNEDAANNICSSINNSGGMAIAYRANVSNEAEVSSLFDFVNKRLGEVTHLVNNVGVLFVKKRACRYQH